MTKDDLYLSNLINENFLDFSSFVRNYLDEYTIHEHILLKPQYLFVYNSSKHLMVDFVGKYESLSQDYQYIAERLKLTATLKKINGSKRNGFPEYYRSRDIQDKVYKLYKKDFDCFDYNFII